MTACLVVYWLLLFTATHLPQVPQELEPGFSDKWQHGLAYGLLAILLTFTLAARGRFHAGTALKSAFVLAWYAAIDEWLQITVGRQCDLFDWYADIAGVIVGLTAASLIVFRLRSRQSP